MINSLFISAVFLSFFYFNLFAQDGKNEQSENSAANILELSRITGSIQSDNQYYINDPKIATQNVPEKMRSNNYLYMTYSLDGFTAGLRYEAYLNPLLGYEGYEGYGIAHRFISYNSDFIDVTAGNFYEQFGSGIVLRTYEERQLGYDNAFDGFRLKIRPARGIEIKGLIGKERDFWSYSDGIVRGLDYNFSVFDVFSRKEESSPIESRSSKYNFIIGGSVVSKYQEDDDVVFKMPENVLAFAERVSLSSDWFSVDAEFGYKYNDPHVVNNNSYNPGTAFLFNASFFKPGLGFTLGLHRFDNFDFRADRNAQIKEMMINYLPTLTKQHLYTLTSIYPYATQPNGEVGLQGELTYTFPKNWFEGKYPLELAVNFSRIQSIDTVHTDEYTYKSDFLKFGKTTLFMDFNFELSKKWSRVLETKFAEIYLVHNRKIVEGKSNLGMVSALIEAFEIRYNFSSRKSIRAELQHLKAFEDFDVPVDQTNGDWAMFLAEYTIAPHWFFSVLDMWNYGNKYEDLKIHYISASTAYILGSTRISFGYGRQRRGLLCVGGVCREVPSSNGFNLSVTTSF